MCVCVCVCACSLIITTSPGSSQSLPSQISSVRAGLDIFDHNSRLSIFWDPLPSLNQNNAHNFSYIIRYSITGIDEVRSIFTSDDRLSCRQEPVGPYRCYLTSSLLLEDQMYTFQVATMNRYGVGPFSDPVNATLHSGIKILLFIAITLHELD